MLHKATSASLVTFLIIILMLILGGVGISLISGENGVFKRTGDTVTGYEKAEGKEDEAMATLMKYFSGTLDLTGGEGTGTTTLNQDLLEAWIMGLIREWSEANLGYEASEGPKIFDKVADLQTTLSSNLDSLNATLAEKADKTTTDSLQSQVDNRATTSALTGVSDRVGTLETTVGNASSGLVKSVADLNSEVTNVQRGNQALYNAITDDTNGVIAKRVKTLENIVNNENTGVIALNTKIGSSSKSGSILSRLDELSTNLYEPRVTAVYTGINSKDNWSYKGQSGFNGPSLGGTVSYVGVASDYLLQEADGGVQVGPANPGAYSSRQSWDSYTFACNKPISVKKGDIIEVEFAAWNEGGGDISRVWFRSGE